MNLLYTDSTHNVGIAAELPGPRQPAYNLITQAQQQATRNKPLDDTGNKAHLQEKCQFCIVLAQ